MAFKINGLDIENLTFEDVTFDEPQEVLKVIFNGETIFEKNNWVTKTGMVSDNDSITLYFNEIRHDWASGTTYSYGTYLPEGTLKLRIDKPDVTKSYSDFMITKETQKALVEGTVGTYPIYLEGYYNISPGHTIEYDTYWEYSIIFTPNTWYYETPEFESQGVPSGYLRIGAEIEYSYKMS